MNCDTRPTTPASKAPSIAPSFAPSVAPSPAPSVAPSSAPSVGEGNRTVEPTAAKSAQTGSPTKAPSVKIPSPIGRDCSIADIEMSTVTVANLEGRSREDLLKLHAAAAKALNLGATKS